MDDIILHKELGLNARMVRKHCAICHEMKNYPELAMLGEVNQKFECVSCGQSYLGKESRKKVGDIISRKCPACNNPKSYVGDKLTDHEAVDFWGFHVCEDCVAKAKEESDAPLDGMVFVVEIINSDSQGLDFTGRYIGVAKDAPLIVDNKELLIEENLMFIEKEAFDSVLGGSHDEEE